MREYIPEWAYSNAKKYAGSDFLNKHVYAIALAIVAERETASDLLNAARCALGHLTGNMDGDMDLGDPIELLRASIAKAEGNQ